MKKLLALVLALAMVMSLAACGGDDKQTTAAPAPAATTKAPEAQTTAAPQPQTTEAPQPQTTEAPPATEPPATEPPATEPPATEPPATEPPAEPELVATLQILNPLLADLELITDPENTRYQAYWLNGYQIGAVGENHFWFEVAGETEVSAVSYNDGYAATLGDYATMRQQAITLDVPENLQKNFADGLIFGTGIKRDSLPWMTGWVLIGPEAIVLTPADGYENAAYLFEDVNMVDAESYDFICVDGYTEEIFKDDLEDVAIFFNEGRVDATSIASAPWTLWDILYIVPHDLTPETAAEQELEEGTTYKLTIFNTAVKEAEPDYFGPSGGTIVAAYRGSDILAAAGLQDANVTVKAVSLGDSATTEIPFEEFAERYVAPNDSKDRGAYTVGRSQVYGNVTINVGVYMFGDTGLFFVPENVTDENRLALTDVLARLGIADYTAVKVICDDGFSETIDAADLEGICIYHLADRIDTDSFMYAPDTLRNTVTIEIYK